ncbi:hypothetical protein C5167_012678, partial [Papaver somniferum]
VLGCFPIHFATIGGAAFIGYLQLEFYGRKQAAQLLHTVMHAIAMSKSVVCASTVLWLTMDWTSDVLAIFNLKVLEQLDAHRRNGCYRLSNLHQIVIVSSMKNEDLKL